MDKELLQSLSTLFDEKLKPIHDDIKDIKIKLNSVVDQTADLTEFKTETLAQLNNIKNNLNNVESVTASNWKDLTKLRSSFK